MDNQRLSILFDDVGVEYNWRARLFVLYGWFQSLLSTTQQKSEACEKDIRPIIRTGNKLLEELERFGFLLVFEDDASEYNGKISQYCVGWKKRSIFWDLPYWRTNMIRHTLDVKHIEKNFFYNIFNTLMCVPGKTKDHLKARKDLIELGIRSELHPVISNIPKAS